MLIENKFIVNCDWLQYSVICEDAEPELFCPDGYRIEVYPGNNIFKHRAIVLDAQGTKWLTLLWGPHSRVLDSRLMTVQVANSLLYDGMILWADSVLHQVVSCRFNSIGRLDVCCDFEVSSRLWRVIRGLASGSVYVCRKSEGSVFWHVDAGAGGRVPHCISWGRPSTEIRPKVYNKSFELCPDGGPDFDKPYIVAQWSAAGFDIRKVWRCEFSLHSSGQLQWDGRSLSLVDAFDDELLGRMFCSLYHSRFVCRHADGASVGHHNNDRLCQFLAVPCPDGSFSWRPASGVRMPTSEQVTLLRRLMIQLEGSVSMASLTVFDGLAAAVLSVCSLDGVRAYFGFRFGCPPEVYLDRLRSSVGAGFCEPDMPPSMSWT